MRPLLLPTEPFPTRCSSVQFHSHITSNMRTKTWTRGIKSCSLAMTFSTFTWTLHNVFIYDSNLWSQASILEIDPVLDLHAPRLQTDFLKGRCEYSLNIQSRRWQYDLQSLQLD